MPKEIFRTLINKKKFSIMGLDMYLEKKTYIGANFKRRKISGIIDIKKQDSFLAAQK